RRRHTRWPRDWSSDVCSSDLEAFTIVYEPFKTLPDPPYAFCYVMLDGADTGLGGYFRGIDLRDPASAALRLAIGTRVITRFADRSEERRVGKECSYARARE